METEAGASKARCVSCREEIAVGDRYAHGDHIKCGVCGTKHKVVRGDRLRLVIADVGPLRDVLAQNERLVERLEAELAHARASLGIGANGIGIGVAYALYQMGINQAPISKGLLWTSIAVGDLRRPAARARELVLPRQAQRDHAAHQRARGSALGGPEAPHPDPRSEPSLVGGTLRRVPPLTPRSLRPSESGSARSPLLLRAAAARLLTESGRTPGASRPCDRSRTSSAAGPSAGR
jgi:predicted RNA-binding Zn-ribbon protein involved in translation (DUF1610 family)